MQEGSFLDHLEALRQVLLRCAAALALAFPLGWFLAARLLPGFIALTLPESLPSLHYFSPMEAFLTELKAGLVLSFALSFPYVAWQFWGFLSPALYRRERRALSLAVLASALLFVAGAAFVLLAILPVIMRFSASFASPALTPVIGLAHFVGLAGGLMLAGGLLFQLPLVVMLLARFGILRPETLKRSRPYAVVALLVLAALFTPPDVVSQVLLFLPSYALFELGLLLASLGARQAEQGA